VIQAQGRQPLHRFDGIPIQYIMAGALSQGHNQLAVLADGHSQDDASLQAVQTSHR
jgi:hypothetical protein